MKNLTVSESSACLGRGKSQWISMIEGIAIFGLTVEMYFL